MQNQVQENTPTQRMCRVAGVATNGEYVLLHRAEEDDFWSLPGGGCEYMETTVEAVRREMLEEMGIEVEVQRLLWVVENFYLTLGEPEHELEFCYLISFPENPEWYDRTRTLSGIEDNQTLTYQWFHVKELEELILYPEFLKQGLQTLPDRVEHVVSRAI